MNSSWRTTHELSLCFPNEKGGNCLRSGGRPAEMGTSVGATSSSCRKQKLLMTETSYSDKFGPGRLQLFAWSKTAREAGWWGWFPDREREFQFDRNRSRNPFYVKVGGRCLDREVWRGIRSPSPRDAYFWFPSPRQCHVVGYVIVGTVWSISNQRTASSQLITRRVGR